jgi:sugar phosphate isomerase/epimerase
MNIPDQLGVSTDSLFGVSLDAAVQQLRNCGFSVFELIPADFQGAGGFPYTELNPGVWPYDCDEAETERLREQLSCFQTLTLHAPHLGTMFGSRNPGVREVANQQYLDFMKFAVRLGSRIISFHHAGFEASVDFAREALPYAHEHDLLLAYENGPDVEALETILEAIDDDRFGLLLDVGHVANGRHDAAELIRKWNSRIVEIHASGVYTGDQYRAADRWGIDHFPLEMNDAVDYPAILAALKEIDFQGPIILEICYARTNDDILQYCLQAREYLTDLQEQMKPEGPGRR